MPLPDSTQTDSLLSAHSAALAQKDSLIEVLQGQLVNKQEVVASLKKIAAAQADDTWLWGKDFWQTVIAVIGSGLVALGVALLTNWFQKSQFKQAQIKQNERHQDILDLQKEHFTKGLEYQEQKFKKETRLKEIDIEKATLLEIKEKLFVNFDEFKTNVLSLLPIETESRLAQLNNHSANFNTKIFDLYSYVIHELKFIDISTRLKVLHQRISHFIPAERDSFIPFFNIVANEVLEIYGSSRFRSGDCITETLRKLEHEKSSLLNVEQEYTYEEVPLDIPDELDIEIEGACKEILDEKLKKFDHQTIATILNEENRDTYIKIYNDVIDTLSKELRSPIRSEMLTYLDNQINEKELNLLIDHIFYGLKDKIHDIVIEHLAKRVGENMMQVLSEKFPELEIPLDQSDASL